MWRATDLLLERPVAVKVLRPEYSDHPETLERFRKEAKNAGALSNPHVAQVYDYGPSGPGGSPYLVMEFVNGPSLADLLMVDPIDPVRALDVVAQAADGLAAAHKAGVVHRDIKPGNILISDEGHVKVTDFGIAHAAGQAPVTGPGLVMGTTQYMAPERIAGVPGTAASDLYALGIVLHECLTGVPPHDGTAAEVMAAHLYLPLPPLPVGVPPEIEDLVARLTAKDPAKRISDARELADLAARLRDSLAGAALVPSARAAFQSGPDTASPGPAPQAAGLLAEPTPGWAGGNGPAYADRAGRDFTRNTAAMAPPGAVADSAYFSDEWNVPPRMSPPSGPAGLAQPDQRNPRRRAAALAVGAAVLASTGLVAMLVSGAFSGTPTVNQPPAGSSTTGSPTQSRVPSHSATGASHSSGVGPSSAAAPGVSSPRASHGVKTASTSPSAHPSTSSAPGGTGSGTPSGGTPSGSPSGSPTTAPSGSPSPPSSESPSASPSPSACLLGLCL